MRIDKDFLDGLSAQAASSERLRMNYDLRNSAEDQSQRMLNALEPGTVVPVHRHRGTSETVVVLRGAVRQNFYSEAGELMESFVVSAGALRSGSAGASGIECSMFVVPVGQWHNSEALERGTVIFEAKDGGYEPMAMGDVMPADVALKARLDRFIEEERRSCSMEVVTAEYVWRMWGGKVPLEEIERVMGE